MMASVATEPSPQVAAPAGRWWSNDWVPRALSLLLFLAAWQWLGPLIPSALVPTPGEVAEFVWAEIRVDTLAPYSLYQSFGISLSRLAIGLLASFAIGVPLGLAMGASKRVEALLHDFVVAGITMPALIWALLVAVWFGFVFHTPIVTVVLGAMPFVIINVAEGVKARPRDLVAMAHAFRMSRSRRLRHLTVPALSPYLFAAFRFALSIGWKALMIAELFGADRGVGWMLRYWYDGHRIQGLVAYAVFFVVFTVLVDRMILAWMERRVFAWRDSTA